MAKDKSRPEAMEHAEAILERLLTLAEKRRAAKAKRESLFAQRDDLENQIDEFEDKASKECIDIKAECHDVTCDIDRLRTEIKWYADQIERVIIDSAQAKFDFMDDPTKPPKDIGSTKKPKEKGPLLDFPAGAAKLGEAGSSPAEGTDQQLAASVKELGLQPSLTKSLIERGFETINDLAKFVDGGGSLQQSLGRGVDNAKEIEKKLASYRKKHRSAMVERERSEE